MKLQAYLSSVNAIIDACTNDASVAYVRNELEQLRATLEDHLRSELAASAGRLSAVSAVKAMLKAAGAGGPASASATAFRRTACAITCRCPSVPRTSATALTLTRS